MDISCSEFFQLKPVVGKSSAAVIFSIRHHISYYRNPVTLSYSAKKLAPGEEMLDLTLTFTKPIQIVVLRFDSTSSKYPKCFVAYSKS